MAHETITHLDDLKAVGESLALDFNNTADREGGRVIVEWLHSYDDFLMWAVGRGSLTAAQAAHLRDVLNPSQKEVALSQSYRLREAIYGVGSAVSAHLEPTPNALEDLQGFIAQAMTTRQMLRGADGFYWGWVWSENTPEMLYPLWPIAYDMGEVLTGRAQLLRECAAEDCGWLFLDTSRNHSRRWCDMSACGNRQKAKRHYHRAKQGYAQQP